MNVYPKRETPSLLLLEKVPAGGCGGDTLRDCRAEKDVQGRIPCYSGTFLPALALVVGVPSTSAACGRHLRKPEKAFLASVRGDTFDQLLSFVTFRAAGSRPYSILPEFVQRVLTRAIIVHGIPGRKFVLFAHLFAVFPLLRVVFPGTVRVRCKASLGIASVGVPVFAMEFIGRSVGSVFLYLFHFIAL